MADTDSPTLTDRFASALTYAHELHYSQIRKGSGTPYIGHVLAVAALVIEAGGNEDEAIAALLHDGPEDAGGKVILKKIRDCFGEKVEDIVEHCSDTLVEDRSKKEEWWQRKRSYQGKLAEGSDSVLLVSLADKVHNAEATLEDLQREGTAVFDRFSTGRDGTLWNYARLLEIYRRRGSHRLKPLMDRLEYAVDGIAGGAAERVLATFFEPESIAQDSEPMLHVVAGGVCTGKSTLIREGGHAIAGPAGSAHYVHLDAPRIFLALCQGEVLSFPGELEPQMEAIGQTVVRRAVAERRHIVVEVIGADPEPLETVLKRFRDLGYSIHGSWPTCDVDTADERNRTRGGNNISAYYAEPFHYRWLLTV